MPYKDPEARKEAASRRRKANLPYYAQKQREYQATVDLEKKRQARQRYREKNRETLKLKERARYQMPGYREGRITYAKNYRIEQYPKYLVSHVKRRAKEMGLPFDLEPQDIKVPSVCPVLGIPLSIEGKGQRDDCPSIDRIIPELGYVKGNIRIISMRANGFKSDATLAEMELILEDLRRIHANRNK